MDGVSVPHEPPPTMLSMSTIDLVTPFGMAGLAIASVGLWTVRVALAARARRAAGAVVAAVEALVFTLAFTRLASDLDSPARVGGYAVGVAIGTLLGLSIDERMSGGQSEVRVAVNGLQPALVQSLRQQGWPATSLTADGPSGPVTLVFVAADDARMPSLLQELGRVAPEAFWTIHRLGKVHASPLPQGLFQVRPERIRKVGLHGSR